MQALIPGRPLQHRTDVAQGLAFRICKLRFKPIWKLRVEGSPFRASRLLDQGVLGDEPDHEQNLRCSCPSQL